MTGIVVFPICETIGCTHGAAYVVDWPGERKYLCCPCCKRRAESIAAAMGVDLAVQGYDGGQCPPKVAP